MPRPRKKTRKKKSWNTPDLPKGKPWERNCTEPKEEIPVEKKNEVKLTHHAIDRASTRTFNKWNKKQGITIWLYNAAVKALKRGRKERVRYDRVEVIDNQMRFVFEDKEPPVLLTVMEA